MMEAINDGKNLHACPSLCHALRLVLLVVELNWFHKLLNVKGVCRESPALNSRIQAVIVADSVLVGELSFRKRLD